MNNQRSYRRTMNLRTDSEGFQIRRIVADSGGMIGLRPSDFVAAAYRGIVKPIVEYCDDRGFYLEDLDRSNVVGLFAGIPGVRAPKIHLFSWSCIRPVGAI